MKYIWAVLVDFAQCIVEPSIANSNIQHEHQPSIKFAQLGEHVFAQLPHYYSVVHQLLYYVVSILLIRNPVKGKLQESQINNTNSTLTPTYNI